MGNLPKWREMDRKRPHQPERFASYTEMIDDDGHVYGFRLPDGQVFKTDEEGGWYDEYRNYYDANGNPANPPAFGDDDDFEDGDHDSLLDDYDFQEDDLNSVDYSDVQNLVDIETKVDQLRKQVGQSSFRLFIASLPSWANEYKLRAFFCEGRQIKNISIVVSSHPNNDRRKEATITLTDLEDAIECVRKHRKRLENSWDIFIEVEKLGVDSDEEYEDISGNQQRPTTSNRRPPHGRNNEFRRNQPEVVIERAKKTEQEQPAVQAKPTNPPKPQEQKQQNEQRQQVRVEETKVQSQPIEKPKVQNTEATTKPNESQPKAPAPKESSVRTISTQPPKVEKLVGPQEATLSTWDIPLVKKSQKKTSK
eukprot:TRINITY_DN1377_c0_g2_i2.p1 TRINITY_DN1377_c0_g2~~TRINITY_DN1377_c0_g2_i2.p1  ORF type:complete len:365 (+),score=115.60 TRINITY_DN1377_c0_g2_i2:101-1195(+)